MERLRSIEETAETLGLSPWTVRRYVQVGKIRPIRIGRRVLIEQTEIERIIDSGKDKRNFSDMKEVNHDVR